MTTTQQIITIANQLANQGKKPTVALIKTQLSSPVPLPVIIATLKNWHHEPDNINDNMPIASTEQTPNDSLALMIDKAVKQAIAPLQAELDEIKTLLANLNISSK